MAPANPSAAPVAQPDGATGVLVLADGTVLWGVGYGTAGAGVGEICFNTAMTGYQEILTDPSYAGQIITFTFPHIGNVGANPEDMERGVHGALGAITRELPTQPSNFRSVQTLPEWMAAQGLIGLAGIDTRALTRRIREDARGQVPELRRAAAWVVESFQPFSSRIGTPRASSMARMRRVTTRSTAARLFCRSPNVWTIM